MPAQPSPLSSADRFAAIAAILSGSPEERDRARWQTLVLDVVQHLGEIVPMRRQYPALLDGVSLEQLRSLVRSADPDPVLLGAFVQWRADVVFLEVTNGKRLRTLATALEYIRELQSRGRTDAPLARHAEAIKQHLAFVWHLPPPTAQDSARTWADRHCRRTDLLPDSWRTL